MVDYSTNAKKHRAKFVNKKGTKAVYHELKFDRPKKKAPEEEEWVKNLHFRKQRTQAEIQYEKDVLEQHEETNQQIQEALEAADDVEDDIQEMKDNFKAITDKYQFCLEKEKEMQAAAKAKKSPALLAEAKKMREQAEQQMKSYQAQVIARLHIEKDKTKTGWRN